MHMFGKVGLRDEGFSIIEIMVTLLILSILIGIVIMTMMVSRDKAREAACKANLRTIHAAIEQYHAAYENYPEADDKDELFQLLVPDFLKKAVSCPSGYNYKYYKKTGTIECTKPSHNP